MTEMREHESRSGQRKGECGVMVKPWDEGCRNMPSHYLDRRKRSYAECLEARKKLHAMRRQAGVCPLCGDPHRPVNLEYETCESCYLDAQGDVIDLDDERKFRKLERLMEGDEG